MTKFIATYIPSDLTKLMSSLENSDYEIIDSGEEIQIIGECKREDFEIAFNRLSSLVAKSKSAMLVSLRCMDGGEK